MTTCAHPDCDRPRYGTHRLCSRHDRERRDNSDLPRCQWPGCDRAAAAKGYCHRCYLRARDSYTGRGAAIRELEHLAGTDTLASIAARLGIKPNSIYRTLQRAGRVDLWRRLRGAA